MRAATKTGFAVAVLVVLSWPIGAFAQSADEAQIRALEDRFVAAVNGKDVDAIMKVYVGDDSLFVFDVTPPREYVGAVAYRKDWEEFLKGFDGSPRFELSNLAITSSGDLAFSHSIQHVSGKDAKGGAIDVTVRVTDAYRKLDGKWLIVHEHVSVPVDFETGKPDLTSKP